MTRPEKLCGETHKVKFHTLEDGDVSFYVTINCDDEGLPVEVFFNVKDSKYWEHLVVVSTMISRLLQAGIPLPDIAEDLCQVHSPRTGHIAPGKGYVGSVYARIGALFKEWGGDE